MTVSQIAHISTSADSGEIDVFSALTRNRRFAKLNSKTNKPVPAMRLIALKPCAP
jgi:hypothetical protein